MEKLAHNVFDKFQGAEAQEIKWLSRLSVFLTNKMWFYFLPIYQNEKIAGDQL